MLAFDTYFLIAMLAFGLALMIFGLRLKMSLLNIMSLFVWLFLLIQLSDYALLVAVFIGMMFTQIYIVIRGGLDE
jgi:hypothetical protein